MADEQATGLGFLIDRLRADPELAPLFAQAEQGTGAVIDGAWGSSCALLVAALARVVPGPTLIVVAQHRQLDDLLLDVQSFSGQTAVTIPAWDQLPSEMLSTDAVAGARLQALRSIEAPTPPALVVASIAALLQPVPSRALREASSRTFRVGQTLDVDALMAWLIERGFEHLPAIEAPGEFRLHGGILDLFPADWTEPLRIELFGDEIESIRTFEVESQRRLETLDQATMSVMDANWLQGDPAQTASLLDSLPANTTCILIETADIVLQAKAYLERVGNPRGLFSPQSVLARCAQHACFQISPLLAEGRPDFHVRVASLERLQGQRQEALEQLAAILEEGDHALIACHNDAALTRLQELLSENAPQLAARCELRVGRVGHGFRLLRDRLLVLSDNELFARQEVARAPRRKRLETRAIDTFLDLQPGDLVVHLSHGIGRFRGMKLVEKHGVREEHLQLEFREALQMFVPVSLIHLVQKYIGGAKASPELSKVGSNVWGKKKQKVAEAVSDMAADMLQLQAERDSKPGIACPNDTHLMQEFEAEFPYTETDDQLRAIADLKRDMQLPRPMDRLICGDVGFGKTEVALRATFKAIDAGRQVAVLVPTTVLAEQHFRSFSERMAEFPVNLASLSRFRTKAEQKQIVQGLAEGAIDLVIGTHRLVSPDVRFKDLGLLVIDEEQRFGVEAKEILKRLRLEVDVLTLSATPIPRTLHLSLLGVRDISNLETPPQDRVAVETRIARFDEGLIRQAIVRELNRNGQIYFVHNRVYNIQTMADRLLAMVPEARVGVVHGQMGADEMETVMVAFVRGELDILVATTIIESGLDIPNANTMFINQADIYGLADLHQLRGRVGRYKHRAYCYLLLDPNKTVTPQASKRLKAIEEYSELGSGFKIAMRDLEIRGAGNILGTEQSGHISAVGYELYCQLLENAVRALKGESLREYRHVQIDLPISAYLPDEYIPPGRLKIEMYRKLSNTTKLEELAAWSDEVRDRFGPIPEPVERLMEIRELQLMAQAWRIDEIRLEGEYAVFGYRLPRRIRQLAEKSPLPLRIVDDRQAYLVFPGKPPQGVKLLALLKAVLQPQAPSA